MHVSCKRDKPIAVGCVMSALIKRREASQDDNACTGDQVSCALRFILHQCVQLNFDASFVPGTRCVLYSGFWPSARAGCYIFRSRTSIERSSEPESSHLAGSLNPTSNPLLLAPITETMLNHRYPQVSNNVDRWAGSFHHSELQKARQIHSSQARIFTGISPT